MTGFMKTILTLTIFLYNHVILKKSPTVDNTRLVSDSAVNDQRRVLHNSAGLTHELRLLVSSDDASVGGPEL